MKKNIIFSFVALMLSAALLLGCVGSSNMNNTNASNTSSTNNTILPNMSANTSENRFICDTDGESMSLDEAVMIAKQGECGNDLVLNCVCPEGYVKEGTACNPTCYYSTPKCLAPSLMCEASYVCNNNTGTLWINMNLTKTGCSPACVVNLANKSAEINWRCTGLIIPETNLTEKAVCTDPPCLLPYFLACNPSELSMDFVGNTTYVITVAGLENENCHYATKITDKEGNALQGMPAMDCVVPKEKISMDMLGHLFGSDKEPGKEAIKAQQDKLQADYCTTS